MYLAFYLQPPIGAAIPHDRTEPNIGQLRIVDFRIEYESIRNEYSVRIRKFKYLHISYS